MATIKGFGQVDTDGKDGYVTITQNDQKIEIPANVVGILIEQLKVARDDAKAASNPA